MPPAREVNASFAGTPGAWLNRVMITHVIRNAALLCALAIAPVAVASEALPSLDDPELARGPYARMHTFYEATFLNVDVAAVDVRFGSGTRDRLRALAAGKKYSDGLADRLARTAMNADEAVVQLEFARDVSFDRWLEEARASLKLAYATKFVDKQAYRETYHRLPSWFESVKPRGFKEGDRLLYRVQPKRMRTVLVSKKNERFVDQTENGDQPSRTMLASYFTEGTQFREGLLRSLFSK